MLGTAEKEAEDYTAKAEAAENSGFMIGELGAMQKRYKLQAEFAEEAKELCLPQFFLETGSSDLWGDSKVFLEPENLTKGFSLRNQDTEINFQLATGEVYEVNLAEQGEAVRRIQQMGFERREEELILGENARKLLGK